MQVIDPEPQSTIKITIKLTINQSIDRSIVNWNNNTTKFHQSDEKLGLNADNEIKMTMNNTNKPEKTTLKYKSFGTKNSFFGSYLNGGRELAFDTILAFKSQINWKYGNTLKYYDFRYIKFIYLYYGEETKLGDKHCNYVRI